MARFRSVCFTINNYSDDELNNLKNNKENFKYLVFQQEIGENGGTRHIQGYATSSNPRGLASWKSIISARAHIEQARGDAESNRRYCTKEDTREPGTEPFEYGEMARPGKRTDLDELGTRVRAGEAISTLAEQFPGDFIRYGQGIKRYAELFSGVREWKTEVFWFYGPTGTGKSREASQLAPGAYWKMGASKWWDGYDGQADVIVDDYRRDLCTFSELLRLFDRYPMRVEYKGGSCSFLARRLFITTPKSPLETWAGRAEEDLRQLTRRITEVRYFPTMFAGLFTSQQSQTSQPEEELGPDQRVEEAEENEIDLESIERFVSDLVNTNHVCTFNCAN